MTIKEVKYGTFMAHATVTTKSGREAQLTVSIPLTTPEQDRQKALEAQLQEMVDKMKAEPCEGC